MLKNKRKNDTLNIKITIKCPAIKVEIDEDLINKEKLKDIKYAVKIFSREIILDNTYVNYSNTKYNNHFILERGWKQFCKLLNKTEFGKKANDLQSNALQAGYQCMVLSYIYMCLQDIGYDCEGIYLIIPEKSVLKVSIEKDTYCEYLRYPGKWQRW